VSPRKKVGHSLRWCETCRLFVEWLRWAETEPHGLTVFLWDRFRAHRRTGA
jgi:hypothetical protein